MITRIFAAAALAAGITSMLASPASACLSCGCGGSGSSADLGAIGGAASLFSLGSRWLVQEGVSFRSISGSFNERGEWTPVPVDGSLRSVQTTLGLSYFPTMGTSLGIQLPVVANALDKATWGPLGSLNPTDLPRATGAGVGDIAIQGSAKLYEADVWAIAGWAGATAPTGNATGDPQALSGAGVWSGSGGLLALAQPGDWELSANVGYQRPFSRPELSASTFYVGDAWLYQAQVNRRLNDWLRLGLGLNGYAGQGRFGASDQPQPMAKIKLVPSSQLALTPTEGVRVALGWDPASYGTNAMTDLTVYAVFYQYAP
jgi:hypothetical protein